MDSQKCKEELNDLLSDMCIPTPDHLKAISFALTVLERYGKMWETIMGREKQITSLESDLARMKDIVVLILPLAKGYVANHNVGSNAEYIKTAEQALRLGE